MTQPIAAPPTPPKKKTSGLAIAAFVLSLFMCLPPLSLLGAVLGIVALIRMGGRDDLGGKGLAIASIPLGAVSIFVGGILAAIAIPNFLAFQARSKMSEAKSNLMAVYTAERSYAAEHGGYLEDMHAIGFRPEPGNRYAYFLAPRGATDARDGSGSAPPASPVIIGVDRVRYPAARGFATLADTGCPVTLKRADAGPPLQVGAAGTTARPDFVAVAAGNVDNDPTIDCWSISSADRISASGERVPHGVPFHERDDIGN